MPAFAFIEQDIEIRILSIGGDGRIHRCSLSVQGLHHADQWLAYYRDSWGNSLDSLARYVESGPT
jgi:hypothetical protein